MQVDTAGKLTTLHRREARPGGWERAVCGWLWVVGCWWAVGGLLVGGVGVGCFPWCCGGLLSPVPLREDAPPPSSSPLACMSQIPRHSMPHTLPHPHPHSPRVVCGGMASSSARLPPVRYVRREAQRRNYCKILEALEVREAIPCPPSPSTQWVPPLLQSPHPIPETTPCFSAAISTILPPKSWGLECSPF